jgi:ribonuclease HII
VSDSKIVPKQYRKRLAEVIWQTAIAIGVGEVTPSELDFLNRVEATRLAMLRAVTSCKHTLKNRPIKPEFLLVDGSHSVPIGVKQYPMLGLDKKSLCCAAASIVAKVYRDEIMEALHQSYPYYAWNSNKGYASDEHLLGLDRHGLQLGIHRTKYWPIRPSPRLEAGKEDMWKERRRRWRMETLRRLGTEVAQTSMTLRPPLWVPSDNFKALHLEEVHFTKSMKSLKKKSKEQRMREKSTTCTGNSAQS